MSRNTERRVEVAVPILDPDLKEEIDQLIDIQLMDNVKARHQIGKGVYQKLPVPPGAPSVDSQIELFRCAYLEAGNPLPEWLVRKGSVPLPEDSR